MALDAFKNFAIGTLSTGYDASAVSIILTSGHGARFPAPPFNATWWNSTDYSNPSLDPNVEIVRVTAVSTDTFTITRGQEGTSASTKNTAAKTYNIHAGLTAKSLNTDYLAGVSATFADGSASTPSISWASGTTTGLYRSAANEVGFTINGVSTLKVQTYSGGNGIQAGGQDLFIRNSTTTSQLSLQASLFDFYAGSSTARFTLDSSGLRPSTDNVTPLGDITHRWVSTYAGILYYNVKVTAKTSNYSVLTTDSAIHFTNGGAAGTVNFTLPTAALNLYYAFAVTTNGQTLTVTAGGSDTIRSGGTVSAAGGTMSSSSKGSVIEIVAMAANEWYVKSIVGTWSGPT